MQSPQMWPQRQGYQPVPQHRASSRVPQRAQRAPQPHAPAAVGPGQSLGDFEGGVGQGSQAGQVPELEARLKREMGRRQLPLSAGGGKLVVVLKQAEQGWLARSRNLRRTCKCKGCSEQPAFRE